jgi:enoyl-CoA hydratase/carnithine racemase
LVKSSGKVVAARRWPSTVGAEEGATMTPHGCVVLDKDGGIARVTLNRPAQMNAISPELLEDLWAVCEDVERDGRVKVVTLTGAGRAFSAGADLRAVRDLSPDPERWAAFMALWHRVFNRIEALPQPVIAGVHGVALAGGLELVLVCDLAVADEEARVGDQHANFGLVAGGGGSQRLPRVVGPRRAKELMLLGGWLTAREAFDWGLVNRVVPAGQLRAVLDEMAGTLARLSAGASRTAKALVNRSGDVDLASGLDLEIAMVGQHMRSADAAEGLRAFAEKRTPAFA